MSDSDSDCYMELDVFAANTQASQGLHLFQYPLRHKERPYQDKNNSLAKVFVQSQPNADKASTERQSFKLQYDLKTEAKDGKIANYDINAMDHRISSFSLQSESVPATREGIDPNYFIGQITG